MFFNLPLLQHSGQGVLGFIIFGNHHQAAGILVQAVDNTRAEFPADAAELG